MIWIPSYCGYSALPLWVVIVINGKSLIASPCRLLAFQEPYQVLPETCACEAVNHCINTGIEHGQYDTDFMCVTVY